MMKDIEQIKKELLQIAKEYIDSPLDGIDTSANLKYLGLNSFVAAAMINEIEEHFGKPIPDSKLYGFKSLDDIIAFLMN